MAQATGNTGGGAAAASEASGSTGTSDVTYNLVSILYHALQGADTYDQYIRDAKQAGNKDLAKFFQDVKRENQRRAETARRLLIQQSQQEAQ